MAGTAAQEHRAPEVARRDFAERVEMRRDKALAYTALQRAQPSVHVGLAKKAQETRCQRQVGKTAGHDQTFVIGLRRQSHYQRALVVLPRFREAAGFVAGHDQMPEVGIRIHQDLDGSGALRTVSRSGQRDEQSGSARRQCLDSLHYQGSSACDFNGNPQFIPDREPHTIARVFRTPGAGKDQVLYAFEMLLERVARSDHLFRGAQPGPRLLADFSQRMKIAKLFLLRFGPAEKQRGLSVASRQRLLPFALV